MFSDISEYINIQEKAHETTQNVFFTSYEPLIFLNVCYDEESAKYDIVFILMSNFKANITCNKHSGDKFLVERAFFWHYASCL